MKKRRKARILAMHCLYQYDLIGGEARNIFEITKENFNQKKKQKFDEGFSWDLVEKAVTNIEKINQLITTYSENWDLDRICTIDRALLRLGLAEMLYFEGQPVSIIINEAVEIAKAYSTEDSCRFINAILDRISREVLPQKENKP